MKEFTQLDMPLFAELTWKALPNLNGGRRVSEGSGRREVRGGNSRSEGKGNICKIHLKMIKQK